MAITRPQHGVKERIDIQGEGPASKTRAGFHFGRMFGPCEAPPIVLKQSTSVTLGGHMAYYEVMPILVVAGGQASIKYIPDRNKKRVLQFGALLAKNDMDFAFRDNGSLATEKSDLDATAAVDGLFQIANQLVEAGLPTAPAVSSSTAGAGDVRIYAFVFDGAGNLVGLRDLKKAPLGKVVTPTANASLPIQPAPDVTQASVQS